MVITERWPGWLPVLDSLGFTVYTVYYGGKYLKYQRFFLEMSSSEPVSCGSNKQWIHKEFDCWFGSVSIGFLTEVTQQFYSQPRILALERNAMLYEAKNLSKHYWHRVQH